MMMSSFLMLLADSWSSSGFVSIITAYILTIHFYTVDLSLHYYYTVLVRLFTFLPKFYKIKVHLHLEIELGLL